MKLVLFERGGQLAEPGLLTQRGIVPVARLLGDHRPRPPQEAMQTLIDVFERLRPELERLAENGEALPSDTARLIAPLPRPGKILCSTATYGGSSGQKAPLLMTLKSAESVIGPDQTVQLPDVGSEWQFVPEAELGLVIRGPAKSVSAGNWRDVVFGYTCAVDVMARGDQQFGRDYWLAKADSLNPLGPCIVTVDEIADPNALRVRSFHNGDPAQEYSMRDADYSVAEQVEFATTVMTLYTGEVIACGTSPRGLVPVSDGDTVEIDISAIGRMRLQVAVAARSGA